MVILLMDQISHRISQSILGSFVLCSKTVPQLVLSSFIFIVAAQSAKSGEVDFTPSVQVKQSYTDNLFLANPGSEQGESVTEVSPAFNLEMRGAGFNASVDYTMQNLFYNKFRENNRTFNQLRATSTSEVLQDYLFFDANASEGQRIVNTNGSIGANNIAITNNLANATTFSMSPYYKHSFNNSFDALARYSYSEVNYSQGRSSDSVQSVYDIRLNTPLQKLGYTWEVSVLNQDTNYETANDSLLKKNSIQLGFRLSQRAHFYATSGKDENTYSNSATPDISQSFWLVGTDLQLGIRDSVSFSYGKRFFGPTGSFSWNHRARQLNFNIAYKEEFSNSALTFVNISSNLQNQANNSITTETFLQQLGSMGLTYSFSKTSISARYSDDQRQFQQTGRFTRTKSASFDINVRSTARMTYIFSTIWSKRSDTINNTNNFDTRIRLSAIRKLSSSLDLDFSLLHNLRRGQNSTVDYNESIASVSLTKEFN